MTVIQKGSKAVRISKSNTGSNIAMYIQIYNGEEQVLESKIFSTFLRAEKWANKKLS